MDYRKAYLEHRKSRLPNKDECWKWAMKRKEAGLTQAQLAEDVGVNQNRISYFENGKATDADSEFFHYIYSVKFG